jgi:NAD(P)-dependent dehydrogenase (short-subunit alcohol dehydrogenase family)
MNPAQMFDMTGKTAVVTGASSGLGEGFARTLAAAGATVYAAARRTDRLAALANEIDSIIPVQCDITNADDRDRLIATASSNGPIDVLVNNAGKPGGPDALTETIEDFTSMFEVNVLAAFALSTGLVRSLPENHPASIINISSVVALGSTAPIGGAGYAATKAAILGMTRELAGQWGRRGVRVNAVVPGWFDTEMTDGLFTNDRSATWVRRGTMLNRGGQPGEVDAAILYLASQAGSYVTGQTMIVDGGWTAK